MRPASDNQPLYAAINAKPAQIAAAVPEPPPWHQAWVSLGPKSTEQERLAVYRAVRDAGSIPEEAGFYLISWQIDAMALPDAAVQLRPLKDGPRAEDEDEDAVWLDHLLEAVSSCVEADSPMGPLGLLYREEDGYWEVWVYPTPVELLGGAQDGAVVVPGYRLDLEALRLTFTSVAAFGWDALGLNDPDGPHV